MYRFLARGAESLARFMTVIGSIVLLFLVCLTCVSIVGRALTIFGLAPIHGDFEWVEIGIGFTIFCFMPWCQYARAHATVDLLECLYPRRVNRFIELTTDLALLAIGVLSTRQLYLGMLDKLQFGETTFILQLPLWKAYMAGLSVTGLGLLVSAFCVVRSLIALKDGTSGEIHVAH